MNILGLLVARKGSKGIPNKNLKVLGDKTLLEYTIQSALTSEKLAEVILSTDSEEYADLAISKGLSVPFIRPSEFAQDITPTIDVVIHALSQMEKLNRYFDAVCLLQPTYPFREKGSIDRAIDQFIHSDADSLISVLSVPHEWNPHWIFEKTENGFLKLATGEEEIIRRRQDLPPAFFRDGSIYLTKTEVILASRSLYGKKITYLENNSKYYVNIDTVDDWIKAEEKLVEIKGLL